MKKLIIGLLILTSLSAFSQQVKDFSLTNVVDDKVVALNTYASNPGVVIIFMLNNCPFDDYYVSRIKNLPQDKIPVLLVNSSPDPAESNDNMKKRIEQQGLTIPYLADKAQSLMTDLNAHKSTEAFLLKNTNGKFTIFYHGAIDDNPQVAGDVKANYLKDAIGKLLAGQNADAIDARPVGCNIRRK